jgi:alkanesulfonate monooxygenase SsuD/methylene tetrahydromethanopterin reductase-like flavin-dependent oxidoreductase (luciferase family)
VRLGLYLDMRNPPNWQRPWRGFYESRLERLEEAERLGLDSVWLTEHHLFPDGYLPQPLTFAAAIAARTQRLRIGTAVVLAALRPAQQIAEEAAIVDLISDGRLELGLGVGYMPDEFQAFGVSHSERVQLFRSRVVEVREIFESDRCRPAPLQARLPMWLGVTSPGGARFAGRQGEGLLWIDRELLRHYRQGLEEGGHSPGSARMSSVAHVLLADDPQAARDAIRDFHVYQQGSYRVLASAQESGEGTPDVLGEDLLTLLDEERASGLHAQPPALHVLTPEQAAVYLADWIAGMPVEHLFFYDNIGGMPDDLAARHVELLATRLAPLLDERLPSSSLMPSAQFSDHET